MSGSDILLLVGGTTLIAAILTLFAFQVTATKLERRMDRRSRTLEGPVPGRRSLSTIGLNTESARSSRPSTRPRTRQMETSMGPSTDTMQELSPAPSTSSVAKEAKLHSLQTIRSRSASLHTDAQPSQSTGPKPLTPPGTPPVQRPAKRPVSEIEQEQGPATPPTKNRPENTGGADNISRPSAPAAGLEPAIAPKAPASKRAKRPNPQAERAETTQRRLHQPSTDAPADAASLDLLATLQPSDIGGSLSRDGALPDIFAGLDGAEAGIQGLSEDLSDIDGGGLPAPPPKTPQKSRR